ncbi:MAG: hypothetical protein JXB62_12705 [Pirellulales bacterium]|nr:hypothetical protein [Pirellulales bacterium]
MSPAESIGSKPRVPYRKPRADIYTVLLLIALIAVLVGILCLYLQMGIYDFEIKGGPSVAADRPNVPAMVADPQRETGSPTMADPSACTSVVFPIGLT